MLLLTQVGHLQEFLTKLSAPTTTFWWLCRAQEQLCSQNAPWRGETLIQPRRRDRDLSPEHGMDPKKTFSWGSMPTRVRQTSMMSQCPWWILHPKAVNHRLVEGC